jgi:3',5'-cyclic AMP phosphodiesterase CpdA
MKGVFYRLPFLLIILALGLGCQKETSKQASSFSIGVLTDCQYGDHEIRWGNFFPESPKRLDSIVRFFNRQNLQFRIHLGDFIDQTYSSFDTLMPRWDKLRDPKYHVLGNHDFSVADSLKALVPSRMHLQNRYYSFQENGWRFIVLDGNDISFYGPSEHVSKISVDSLFQKAQRAENPSAKPYNGGLSKKQLNWLNAELEEARSNEQNVLIFSHFPMWPIDNHNVWNNDELIALVDQYPEVKAFFAGHNHQGSYGLRKGVHHLTFKAVVNTPDSSAYALVHFDKNQIQIQGFGREQSRSLSLE